MICNNMYFDEFQGREAYVPCVTSAVDRQLDKLD
jgi:hypothetical protein